jgi:hypothetical protein
MEYMVWIVEITATAFFTKNKSNAYNALKKSGLWDIYVNNYETTHSLGQEYLLDEIHGFFIKKGLIKT